MSSSKNNQFFELRDEFVQSVPNILPVKTAKRDNKSHAFAWLFPFACFVAGSPPQHRRGDFSFPAAGKLPDEKTQIFSWQGSGATQAQNRTHKNQRYDDDYQTFHFIRPCFSHIGPERGTCFFRGLSAAAFSSLLVFSQQCFPGVFHFPLFFAGICGGPKRRPNPLSTVPFMGISPPLPAPGRPQKQVEK